MITFDYTNSQPSLYQNASNLIGSTINQFIVKPFGGAGSSSAGGFIFDILEDEEIVVESLITDNYIETNNAIQDHIALKPLRFTLKGYVGELTNQYQNSLGNIFTQVATLPFVSQLAPKFTAQASQVYAKINNVTQSAQNVVNQATSLFSLFSGSSTNANKQQQGFQFFYNMWRTRQLCSVNTPFGSFDSMAIENVRALQGAAHKDISDFTITFKQIRTTSSISYLNNAVNQSYIQNLGTNTGTPLTADGRVATDFENETNLGNIKGLTANEDNVYSQFANNATPPTLT